jgi:sirohydrochlorin ferrochelatase
VTPPALMLVAHGSRDRRAAEVVARLTAGCTRALHAVPVLASYLDHTDPAPADALISLADRGYEDVVAVPLLFAAAFHARVDLPRAIAAATTARPALRVGSAHALIPSADRIPASLLTALDDALGHGLPDRPDALVLAAAGTSDPAARRTIGAAAHRWGIHHGLPVRVGWASAAAPDPGTAVRELRRRGYRRVAVGSLFLAPGLLTARARDRARAAGAWAVAPPVGAHPALVDVLVQRYRETGSVIADPRRQELSQHGRACAPSGAAGEQGQAYSVGAVGLGHQAGDVGLDRGDTDVEPFGDLRV